MTTKELKLIAPEGVGSFSTVAGTFDVDADGRITVPAEAVRDAVASGFVVDGAVPADLIEAVNAGVDDRANTASNGPSAIGAAAGAVHLEEAAQPGGGSTPA